MKPMCSYGIKNCLISKHEFQILQPKIERPILKAPSPYISNETTYNELHSSTVKRDLNCKI